ncbi:GPI-GlcNAc transferase complex, PIG-H component-domain-containing protein [Kalaharituber pfeilii]|nr:GPI-GlcNAc transferase complex, PIG-H component-domain-containing protein [Kalaharituber pfeilii]
MRNLGIQTRTVSSSAFSPLPPLLFEWLFAAVVPSPSTSPTPNSSSLPDSPTTPDHNKKPNCNSPLSSFITTRTNYTPPSILVSAGTTRFIPTSQIQDVWIQEGFIGFEVRYFLGVVVKEEQEIVVVFPRTLPRREVVEVVWRGLRGCLYEKEGSGEGLEERAVAGAGPRGGVGRK